MILPLYCTLSTTQQLHKLVNQECMFVGQVVGQTLLSVSPVELCKTWNQEFHKSIGLFLF